MAHRHAGTNNTLHDIANDRVENHFTEKPTMKPNLLELQIQMHQREIHIRTSNHTKPRKCPVCAETDLVAAQRQGIEIDCCPNCRGVWLDRGELERLTTIETARVAIECQRHIKRGAFRVMALLEVRGPDLHAEACDYTLQAALAKVVKSLERQIRSRKNRRTDKWKTNLQLGLSPNHWSRGLVSARSQSPA